LIVVLLPQKNKEKPMTRIRRKVRRFPRLSESASQSACPQGADDKFLTERARLEKQAFRAIGSLRKMRVELGQIFIQLKATLKHGEWGDYYEETFGGSVSFRSAERYMELATKANSDSLSILKPGMDQYAVNMHKTTERARKETGVVDEPKPERVYRLALRLNTAQRDATILLWASPHRPGAEIELVTVLDSLHIKYGFVSTDALKSGKQEARPA
jgi:hypothetical protein